MMNKIKKIIPILVAFFPLYVFAVDKPSDFKSLIKIGTDIVSNLTKTVAAFALLVFFYGIAQSILASGSGDKTKVEEGRKKMMWGVIGLFVMVSIWGLIEILSGSFGISMSTTPL